MRPPRRITQYFSIVTSRTSQPIVNGEYMGLCRRWLALLLSVDNDSDISSKAWNAQVIRRGRSDSGWLSSLNNYRRLVLRRGTRSYRKNLYVRLANGADALVPRGLTPPLRKLLGSSRSAVLWFKTTEII